MKRNKPLLRSLVRYSSVVALAALQVACTTGAASPPTTPGEPASCGPQSPRDISKAGGTNTIPVPTGDTPNLCNVHFHKPFEHAGLVLPADSATGPAGDPVCHEVENGDKLEFHWVYTSCPLPKPALKGLENCVCNDPKMVLRVYAQAYVVGAAGGNVEQPHEGLVPYPGSTTGDKYNNTTCSSARVNWEVNPAVLRLAKMDLGQWCETNPWIDEGHPHGSRELVTREDWLSPFKPPPKP